MADGEDDDAKPYKVGYGKPPKHSQFKAGCSGNLNGRPAKAKQKTTRHEVLDRELERRVRVKTDGALVTMTVQEAQLRSLIQNALQGKPWANRLLAELQAELEASLKTKAEAPKVGVVVVRRPAVSVEDWVKEYGGQRLPKDPLEGLPGIDPDLLREIKRKKTPEDD